MEFVGGLKKKLEMKKKSTKNESAKKRDELSGSDEEKNRKSLRNSRTSSSGCELLCTKKNQVNNKQI